MVEVGQVPPLKPFLGMLQLVLEALLLPADQAATPEALSRLLPPTMKLLRTLKHCRRACTAAACLLPVCCCHFGGVS